MIKLSRLAKKTIPRTSQKLQKKMQTIFYTRQITLRGIAISEELQIETTKSANTALLNEFPAEPRWADQ